MLADYKDKAAEGHNFFLFDTLDESELTSVLTNCTDFERGVIDLIVLFTFKEKKQINGMIYRKDYEDKITYDAEEITRKYNMFDFHNMPGSDFPARQKDCSYLRSGGESGKAPSLDSIYDIVTAVHYFNDEAVLDPSEYLDIPEDPTFPKGCKLPQYLIVNVCVPHYQPSILRNITQGPSSIFIMVSKLSDACRKRYEAGEPSEADRLLERFLYRPEPPVGNYNVRRRLKCIVKMANYGCEAVQFGRVMNQIVSRYNGTPFLLRDSTSFYELGPNCMICTADANLFGRLAKNSLWKCRSYSMNAILDCCCIIEADQELNDELPENTFLSWRMKAPVFPEFLHSNV